MIPVRRFVLSTALVAATVMSPLAQAETYARNYELQTLDHRFAATLVVDLCRSLDRRPVDCKVQVMNRGMISVYASPEVHAEVVRMLAEKDVVVQAFGFRVILARAGGPGQNSDAIAPEVRQALAAVEELLGLSSMVIDDTGIIRTADRGSTRLATAASDSYNVTLEIRDVVTRREGREVTVELELTSPTTANSAPPLLSSVITLHVGETIVAGTSRAQPGDRQLIVLLTALPVRLED